MREDDEASGRVTLAAVAKEAGVSMPTVSKVLNGRSDVSRATRAKVERLLDLHGYRRRVQPAARYPLIEIVFHELESVWAMELIRGVENVAKENRATVVLTESGTRHTPDPDWLPGVLQRRPLGVVLVFSSLPQDIKRQLRAAAIPFVVIDPAGDPDPDVPSVGSANWAAVSPPPATSPSAATGASPSSPAQATCCARWRASTATARPWRWRAWRWTRA